MSDMILVESIMEVLLTPSLPKSIVKPNYAAINYTHRLHMDNVAISKSLLDGGQNGYPVLCS